jgi:hypothetical protein
MDLSYVPRAVLTEIFLSLPMKDTFNCVRVCKAFHAVFADDMVWRKLHSMWIPLPPILGLTWQQSFKKRYLDWYLPVPRAVEKRLQALTEELWAASKARPSSLCAVLKQKGNVAFINFFSPDYTQFRILRDTIAQPLEIRQCQYYPIRSSNITAYQHFLSFLRLGNHRIVYLMAQQLGTQHITIPANHDAMSYQVEPLCDLVARYESYDCKDEVTRKLKEARKAASGGRTLFFWTIDSVIFVHRENMLVTKQEFCAMLIDLYRRTLPRWKRVREVRMKYRPTLGAASKQYAMNIGRVLPGLLTDECFALSEEAIAALSLVGSCNIAVFSINFPTTRAEVARRRAEWASERCGSIGVNCARAGWGQLLQFASLLQIPQDSIPEERDEPARQQIIALLKARLLELKRLV